MLKLAPLLLLIACASDPPLDPTGTWSLDLTLQRGGTCGTDGKTIAAALVITRLGSDYPVVDPSADSVLGGVDCTTTSCSLTLYETGHGTLSNGQAFMDEVQWNLIMDAQYQVHGSGQVTDTFSDGSSCTEAFLATGGVSG